MVELATAGVCGAATKRVNDGRNAGTAFSVEAAVVALLVVVALSGVVIGRWWSLLIPLVVWPMWFVGLAHDWWGYGLGDGWQFGAAIILVISLLSVAVGVGLRRAGLRFRASRAA
jgi:hypothetical protein